jgi:hypothetical protein
LRIFIACPGDVTAEKERLLKIIERLQGLAHEAGFFLKPKEWWRVIPDMGRPQQLIFDQLDPKSWDIFVGILWLRFGSPSGEVHPATGLPIESGTHEEFLKAYELWKEHRRPRILFYRCDRPPERLDQIDPAQFAKVKDFFQEFETTGAHPGIYKPYQAVEEFADLAYDHLSELIRSAVPKASDRKPPSADSNPSQVFFSCMGAFTFALGMFLMTSYQVVQGHSFGPLLLLIGCIALPLLVGILLALAFRHALGVLNASKSERLMPILGFKMQARWAPMRWVGWFLFLVLPSYIAGHFLLETRKLVLHQDRVPEQGVLAARDMPFPEYYFNARWDLVFDHYPHYWWGEERRYQGWPILQPWLNVILTASAIGGASLFTLCCATGFGLMPARKRLLLEPRKPGEGIASD